jgi:hypothetical protein
MSYAQLDSPLPGLTVTSTGERCCGLRGYQPGAHSLLGMLGDDLLPIDTTFTDPGNLVPPSDFSTPVDTTGLPLTNITTPSLESMYPSTIGTEFTSNGDGTYTNIQTGQSVPYDTAAAITQATIGPATVNLNTQPSQQNLTLTDPNTGVTSTVSTNNLSVAAQALQAAGQLITSAGKLTAQGQALLNQGNLYNAPPTTGFSGAMSSLTSWFTGSTMIAGVPNVAIIGGGLLAVMVVLPALMSGKKRRR